MFKKKPYGAIIILGVLMLAAFTQQQPQETNQGLDVIVFNNPTYYGERVVSYGPAYHQAAADAFCAYWGLDVSPGYDIEAYVDGYYAWYQTSWYIGSDEGGHLFSTIHCTGEF